MNKRIFISFKTAERFIVLPLYERLKADGYDVFMSSEDLKAADNWAERLSWEIRETDMVLAFITQSYIDSQYQVDGELHLANKFQLPVLPVLYNVAPCAIPDDWTYITKHQYYQVSSMNEHAINEIAAICEDVVQKGKVVLDSPEVILKRAENAVQRQDWIEAVKLYEEVAEDLPDAYPEIVYCRLMLAQYAEARVAARNALKFCPDNTDSYFFAALANLAGREDFPSNLLERVTELLIKAWSRKANLKQGYLAYIVSSLYKQRSYAIPDSLINMVKACNRYEYNETLMNWLKMIIWK